MPPHPLSNFEIWKYYQTEPQFNGIFSRNNLSKIKDEAYIRNLDEHESIGTHQVALYMNAENVTYFYRFGVKHIPKEIRKFTGNKNIATDIYKMQGYNSVMCG